MQDDYEPENRVIFYACYDGIPAKPRKKRPEELSGRRVPEPEAGSQVHPDAPAGA